MTIVQYLRVLMVLLAMPVVTTVFFHPTSGSGSGSGTMASVAVRWLPYLVFVAPSVSLGLVLQRFVTAPATALLGPMLIAVAISTSGALWSVTCRAHWRTSAKALIGVRVGLRFTRASLASIARLLPLATVLIGACALMGLALADVTGVSRLTAYLATTPGGLYAVLATAADSGSDVTHVLAVQVIRVFAMLLLAPPLGRWLSRSTASR